VTIDTQSSKVQAKIRNAQLELVPYMMVIGPEESQQNAVAVRDRIEGNLGSMPIEAAIAKLRKEVDERVVRQTVKSDFAGLEADSSEQHEY